MDKNTKERIEKYITSCRKKGADDEKIRSRLIKSGFKKSEVEPVFSSLPKPELKAEPEKKSDNISSPIKEKNQLKKRCIIFLEVFFNCINNYFNCFSINGFF
ncbi:hypothetical protein [Candidatus Venteria ishoeyi]|uniref:Regulatory protein RecX n=1 Tax=Candidatus Venteria ishoeyi TaxID=1899563 RepID=A0A1H6F828_9GAMM|nr:hypothetical protein [Candidatus Venteria ishoeyi]SEH05479.1 Uncharacterised protein [Candidatus Venteria ishoeyi]